MGESILEKASINMTIMIKQQGEMEKQKGHKNG